MKELYNEFFYVPKHGYGKVREKVMLTRITVAIVFIIICIATMSITAYAYFSCTVSSEYNSIKSANFVADVSISIHDDSNNAVEVTKIDSITHTAKLEIDKKYKVVLMPAEENTATTGFCVVSAEKCDKKYHTQQLGVDGDEIIDTITFYLTVTNTTQVEFLAHWGTSSHYADYTNKGNKNELYITDKDEVEMTVRGENASADEPKEDKTTINSLETTENSSTDAVSSTTSTKTDSTQSEAASTDKNTESTMSTSVNSTSSVKGQDTKSTVASTENKEEAASSENTESATTTSVDNASFDTTESNESSTSSSEDTYTTASSQSAESTTIDSVNNTSSKTEDAELTDAESTEMIEQTLSN